MGDDGIKRRAFLKGASLGGATLVAGAPPLRAEPLAQPAATAVTAPRQSEIEPPSQPKTAPLGEGQIYGSDYMVDTLRALGIETIAEVPGSTFAALQESIVNYGLVADSAMQMFTVTHEEIAVAFAHGYAKVAGKPAAALCHSVVGLQHASMAIYNAYCDRAPVIVLTGSLTNPEARDGFVDWLHAVSDGPALTRDFVKFDETPRSLPHFAEATTRAYQMAMTPPYGPAVLALDLDLQESPVPAAGLPQVKIPRVTPPQGQESAVREAAKMLAKAAMPVIVADRAARTPSGLALMIELAETLGAGVIDMQGRMNFPWRHPLNQTSARPNTLASADVVLALEVQDMVGTLRPARGARKISINSGDYYLRQNYQTFEGLAPVDLTIAGDAEATLPSLIEAVRIELGRGSRAMITRRATELGEASAYQLEASRKAAAIGWDVQPITTARLYAELYDQVRGKDWALLNGSHFQNFWPQQLWDAKQHHQFIGDSGGYGLGYLPGAAVGAAYAHKQAGRLPIVVGGDGDFMMAPGAIWTAAFHNVPLLYLVHNNGGYHQERMKLQLQTNARERGVKRAPIGCELPGIDFSRIAQAYGIDAQRVTDPGSLRGAIARGLDVVSRGEPALIDVVAQGR